MKVTTPKTYTVCKQSSSQRPEDDGMAVMIFQTWSEASEFVAANYKQSGYGALYISSDY